MEIKRETWGWSLWVSDPRSKILIQMGARVGDTAPEFKSSNFN